MQNGPLHAGGTEGWYLSQPRNVQKGRCNSEDPKISLWVDVVLGCEFKVCYTVFNSSFSLSEVWPSAISQLELCPVLNGVMQSAINRFGMHWRWTTKPTACYCLNKTSLSKAIKGWRSVYLTPFTVWSGCTAEAHTLLLLTAVFQKIQELCVLSHCYRAGDINNWFIICLLGCLCCN